MRDLQPIARPAARLAALAALLLAPPALAQELEITEPLLAKCAAEATALVRESQGVELEGVPVRIATRQEIEDALVAENTPLWARLTGGDGEAEARGFASTMARFLLAKYAILDDEVLVQAGAFEFLGKLVGIPELASEEVLRVVLLHELVHAADDERFDLEALFAGCDTADAVRTGNAIIEGHAQRVARDLARRQGLSEAFETFTRAIGAPPVDVTEQGAGAELVVRTMTAFMAFSYHEGESFFTYLDAEGGDEAVRRAFTAPPRDPMLIATPEWYLHPERRPRSVFALAPALAPFDAGFPEDEGWTFAQMSVSPTDLVAAMAPLPEEEIRGIGQGLRQSLVRVATLGGGRSQVVLGLFEFGTPAEAHAYLDAYGRLQRARDELMKEGAVRITSARYEALAPPQPDGLLVEKKVLAGPQELDVTALCVTEGAVAVEALASNAPDWALEDLLRAALDTLDRLAPSGSRDE